MKKTADEILKQKLLPIFASEETRDFEMANKYEEIIQAMQDFAAQEVTKIEQEVRDFLFNMHEVVDGKIVFELSDLIKFFPPKQ